MALTLEKILPLNLLDISANVTMTEGVIAPPGLDSAQVIRVDQATTFTFNWTASGLLFIPWFSTSHLQFDVFYELVGPSAAAILVPTTTSTTLGALTTTLTLPPNSVSAAVYRVVVRMMVRPPLPVGVVTPTVICGFEELGLIEYYDA